MKKFLIFLTTVLLVFLISGCKTTPEEPPETADTAVDVQEEPQPEPEKVPEPQEEPEPEPAEEPEETPVVEETDDFVVTQEVFEETFVDIEGLIGELNGIIRSEKYDKWTTYLTREYKEHYGDPDTLLEMSQMPILKKYSIRLRTLRDYFEYVVVPSRSQAKLDDLVFTDNEHIKAIMLINGKRNILYSLEKIDGVWKIGL